MACLTVNTESFESSGFLVFENFLPAFICDQLLATIDAYRTHNAVPEIYRATSDRPLRYLVIDGACIRRALPQVTLLYETVNHFVNTVAAAQFLPLQDQQVACNINITPAGGAYRWHYDRNALTAILYLNEVAGGETECFPNYRVFLGRRLRHSGLQQGLDRVLQAKPMRDTFGKRVVVAPLAGRLLLMRGDRCLHSVRPVTAKGDRINVVMSYDRPGAAYRVANRLNGYLYEPTAKLAGDPNYASSAAANRPVT